jgi:hypothetical protein
MEGKAIAFLRISKPEYNKDWYEKNQLYMNAQTRFRDMSLKPGQADIEEGLISTIPMQIWTGVEQSVNLGQITSISHDANAYIFCVYCIMGYDLRVDKKTGFYTHIIPWKGYIENFWEEGIEMIVTPYINAVVSQFDEGVSRIAMNHARGFVHYDLEERLRDPEYFKESINDSFSSVFHKSKSHCNEHEYRFAIQCSDKPEYYVLKMNPNPKIRFYQLKLEKGASVELVFQNVKLDEAGKIKSFTADILSRFLYEDA